MPMVTFPIRRQRVAHAALRTLQRVTLAFVLVNRPAITFSITPPACRRGGKTDMWLFGGEIVGRERGWRLRGRQTLVCWWLRARWHLAGFARPVRKLRWLFFLPYENDCKGLGVAWGQMLWAFSLVDVPKGPNWLWWTEIIIFLILIC